MKNAGEPTRPAFRGDIQGMRALAVVSVIAAHASVKGLDGGFVGVDIFFVVSGFLITQLICKGIEHDGRFSAWSFYARRARRIVPAATLVLVVTTAASLLYLNFIDAKDAAIDALWSSVFAVNIRFATQGVDYFALEEAPSPLQHYWSLAIEEQFYLVWPLLVGLTVLIVNRVRARKAPTVNLAKGASSPAGHRVPWIPLAAVVFVASAASLTWSIHRTAVSPTSAYFSTFTRVWELGLGALLALVMFAGFKLRHRVAAEVLGILGVAGIAISVLTYTTTMAFPGLPALLPTLSAAALIVAGGNPDAMPWVSRALAVKPARPIGDWSYSLYLWHWPLIVVPQVNMGRHLTLTETVIAVALTFQLGYLTYRFVEQPFRQGTFWKPTWRGVSIYPVALALCVAMSLGASSLATYLGSERGNDPAITTDALHVNGDGIRSLVAASVKAADEGWEIPSDLTPDLLDLTDDLADVGECNYMRPERPLCRRGDPDSDKVIVVTGDSHARAWIPAMEQVARASGYAAYYLVKQQCTAAFSDPGQLGTGAPWPECQEFHQWVVDQITELQPDIIMVATSPPPTGVYDPDGGQLVTSRDGIARVLDQGYDDMFAAYQALAPKVVLVADVPRLPEEPGPCLAARGATLGDCVFEPTAWADQMRDLSIAAAQRADVQVIDPEPWLCYQRRCPVVIGSTIAWRDRGHISATRAAELWVPLGEDLGMLTPSGDASEDADTDTDTD